MIKSVLFQLSVVLMGLALFVTASPSDSINSVNKEKEIDLVSVCKNLQKEPSPLSTNYLDTEYNRCIFYHLAKLAAQLEELTHVEEEQMINNNNNNSDEEEQIASPSSGFMREARRVKQVKQFWKRRVGSGQQRGSKKFW
jgi:hypothetical protein